MSRFASHRHSSRALIVIGVVALLLAQWLGMLHRIEHAGRGHLPALVTALKAGAAPDGATSGFQRAIKQLFHGHDAGACDLYDQVTHGDALWSAALVPLATVTADAPAAVHPAWHLAAQAAGYLARGPPALS